MIKAKITIEVHCETQQELTKAKEKLKQSGYTIISTLDLLGFIATIEQELKEGEI